MLREVHTTLGVQLLIVSSKDDAIDAIDREVPDLVLVNALLSPREENELVAHLRSLENASHLQLLTIPLLSRGEAAPPGKSSLFGFGKKKRAPVVSDGCDLASFGEQVGTYLARAQEVKARPRPRPAQNPAAKVPPPPPVPEYQAPVEEPPAGVPAYDPFTAVPAYNPIATLPLHQPASEEVAVGDVDSLFDRLGFAPAITTTEETAPALPIALEPPPPAAVESEVLIDLDSAIDTSSPSFDLAQVRADAEATLAAEVQRMQAEAAQERERELVRWQADAEALREATEGRARADAEAALTAEVERVQAEAAQERERELARWQAEAEALREETVGRARADAEATLAAEVQRVQAEAAQQRERELARWQADAEALREATVGRARAEAEAALAVELDRVQADTARQRELELAQWQAEAEALREATVGRARAEAEAQAREALAEELARTRADAEQARQHEIARLQAQADERLEEVSRQARQVAESEAARAFAEELARVRTDSEAAAARAMNEEVSRVRADADTRLQAELDRVRREAEEARRAEQAVARAEAERIREAAAREAREVAEAAAARTLDAEVQRVRAEAEAVRAAAEARLAEQSKAQADASQAIAEAERVREAAAREAREIAEAAAARTLEAELRRVRAEADARLKEHNEAQIKAEKIREAAAREARAIAEATAARALEAEIQRVKADADTRLSAELEQLRADAERRRAIELEEMKRQVAMMREAAAQQARAAASEAVAAEMARVSARGGPAPLVPVAVAKATVEAPQAAFLALEPDEPAEPFESRTPSSSYYDLWQAEGSPPVSPGAQVVASTGPSWFREKPWMLPAAAAALLVVCGSIGVTIDASAWAATARKAIASAIPTANAKPETAAAAPAPPATGDLLIETTPKGAAVSVDGTARGKAPLTVTGLAPGRHKVVLQSNDGVVITRDVTVRAGERAVASELMVTGWLTVFSRVPVEVHVGGRRVGASGDEQITMSPGRHKVTFVNKQFNVRETRTIDIQAGSIASHSVKLPTGILTVDAPDGAEVLVDGDRIGSAPIRGASIAIGTRDVLVRHRSFGDLRKVIDVRHGEHVKVTLDAPTPDQPGQSFDGLKVLTESAANPGLRKRRAP